MSLVYEGLKKKKRNQLLAIMGTFFLLVESSAFSNTSPQGEAFTLPPTLSLQEALSFFRIHGFDLLLAEAEVEQATAEQTSASAVPNPILSASMSKTFGYDATDPAVCPSGGCSSLGVAVGLTDQALWTLISGKRRLRKEVAQAVLRSAEYVRKDVQRLLETQVKGQYVQTWLDIQALAFAEEYSSSLTRTMALTKTRYQKGAVSEQDCLKVEIAKLQADQTTDNARATVRFDKLQLAFLLGLRIPTAEFQLSTDFSQAVLFPSWERFKREDLIEWALQQRTDLKQRIIEQERAQASIRLAERMRVPDVALSLQYSQTGTGQSSLQPPTVGIGISLPLPILYQNQGEIAKAKADTHEQQVQYEKTRAKVLSEVQMGINNYELAQTSVKRLETQLFPHAKRVVLLAQNQYEKGLSSLLDWLDAERTYLTISNQRLQSLAQYWMALFQLEQAVGSDPKEYFKEK